MTLSGAVDLITLSSFPRAIVHVDCDAFFTSCESARDPGLKGRPIVTGQERGIVSCPSYEAKARGVKRAMRLNDAARACPGLIILPSDYELYSIYSERIFAIIRRFTPEVEEYSIDEAFCDITGMRRLYRSSYPEIARRIKEEIRNELDLTVSVGVSLSKTLAKICSKQNKPDGFLAVPGNELHLFLKEVPLERVCGFGPNTVALLRKYNIRNVLDYARRPVDFAQKLLGKTGVELWQELRGVAVYPVSKEAKHKYLTISKTKTFSPPSSDRDFVKAQLVRNLESAFIKLRRHELSCRNLTAYLRRSDFSSTAIEGRISRHSSSTLDFTAVCGQLFDGVYESGAVYRSTGVILSDIAEEGFDPADLFDDPVKVERVHKVSAAIDEINYMYGKHTVHLAASHIVCQKTNHPRNCAAWRKNELLKGETSRQRLNIPLLKLK
ncbi:MAG: DNA polymerase IV [Candidatus Omnitrophota bacterium]